MGNDAEVIGIAFVVVYLLFIMAIGLAVYIMEALAVQKMGKACGAPYPWLAWIPYANSYALGYIADKDAEANGRPATHYRKTLLILAIVTNVASIMTIISTMVIYMLGSAGTSDMAGNGELTMKSDISGGMVLILLLLYLIVLGVSITCLVFQYIVLWHVYKLFDPNNAAAFIILSVLISFSVPILLLVVSRKTPAIVPPVNDATFGEPNGTTPSSGGDGNGFYFQ